VTTTQPVVHDAAAKSTDWLTAIEGIGAFAATAVLAFLAFKQMSALRGQAPAAGDQVNIMRQAAADDAASVAKQIAASVAQAQAASDQVDVMRQAAADNAAALQEQIRASVAQGAAIQESARVKLQPIVFGHAVPVVLGPNEQYSIADDLASRSRSCGPGTSCQTGGRRARGATG
jgi:hypothetical protein